ncbi:MAG TPA: hypothetical protein VK832_16510 [Burkholderiaceae bacterium]|nr:hypothetical protein [Burkholderiaceae bacterium]
MSLSSVEPANQICYIEKPPKPLGSAIADFIKEEVKAGKPDKSGTASSASNAQSTSVASTTSINGVGQITGQLISTTA